MAAGREPRRAAQGATLARLLRLLLMMALASGPARAAQWFPLSAVRLEGGPLLQAQQRNRQYLMALDPDRLLAPFRREAGLPQPKPPYGNWESSGLDGHMAGHVLSALALLGAATGDVELRARLDRMVEGLAACQWPSEAGLMAGYLGGIPDGAALWRALARGEVAADNFMLNGRWVPWYNLHKTMAGLRDAHRHGGNATARVLLIRLADWAERITAGLAPEQMQAMLRTEHGGMAEVLVDVYELSGEARHLALARRFVDQALLGPLAAGEDRLTGLHANTQIPKVLGLERIAQHARWPEAQRAAEVFWQAVQGRRSVAIGGNSVKEHFHDRDDFRAMLGEVEGPETCNTHNMLRLTRALFERGPQVRHIDFAERALFNHILSSQHPQTGGLVYFTPMRPQHYRVYSQVDQGMWCCVGSGLEGHARHGDMVYAHEGSALLVNLFVPSTLSWPEQQLRLEQRTEFPDAGRTTLTWRGQPGTRLLRIRIPAWVAPGAAQLQLNGEPVAIEARPGHFLDITRAWADGDELSLSLPMHTWLEALPAPPRHVAVLHGPIVLAARNTPIPGERPAFLADDSRMGHIAAGPVCAPQADGLVITDEAQFLARLAPVAGQPLHFVAHGAALGQRDEARVELMPFFRLHESRYTVYWPQATAQDLDRLRDEAQATEQARQALAAITLDQVAPGEQQPEAEHAYAAEGGETGLHQGRRWRHASGWFGYTLSDPHGLGRVLRLELHAGDAGRRFDVEVNGRPVHRQMLLPAGAQGFYTLDIALPADLPRPAGGALRVRFVAREGSLAGGLYGLRLLKDQ